MRVGDQQVGTPSIMFRAEKSAIEQLPPIAGQIAYATDTQEIGYANGSAWAWVEAFETWTHQQMISAAVWTIPHNKNCYPSVTVVDSAGTVVVGEVRYIDANTIQIAFASEFSGTAYLN